MWYIIYTRSIKVALTHEINDLTVESQKGMVTMAKYNRIKDLREDSDKTQQELADYLGTSSQHYGKYENGNAEIPLSVWIISQG